MKRFGQQRGKRRMRKLTVEWFTKLDNFVGLLHLLWGGEGRVASYLCPRRNTIEDMLRSGISRRNHGPPFHGDTFPVKQYHRGPQKRVRATQNALERDWDRLSTGR